MLPLKLAAVDVKAAVQKGSGPVLAVMVEP
jgi:hypothetical protein